ncbi:hypothetical protein HDU76_005918 [Blyttiomyces sp. JEL0837]|nr:hypothetical protein HDU76_005918 [Blyttiomyces sp. JEL0837]
MSYQQEYPQQQGFGLWGHWSAQEQDVHEARYDNYIRFVTTPHPAHHQQELVSPPPQRFARYFQNLNLDSVPPLPTKYNSTWLQTVLNDHDEQVVIQECQDQQRHFPIPMIKVSPNYQNNVANIANLNNDSDSINNAPLEICNKSPKNDTRTKHQTHRTNPYLYFPPSTWEPIKYLPNGKVWRGGSHSPSPSPSRSLFPSCSKSQYWHNNDQEYPQSISHRDSQYQPTSKFAHDQYQHETQLPSPHSLDASEMVGASVDSCKPTTSTQGFHQQIYHFSI